MQLIATYFSQRGVKNLTVANRTIEKAQSFVESFSAKAIRIGDIPQELPQIDVMVTATASQLQSLVWEWWSMWSVCEVVVG